MKSHIVIVVMRPISLTSSIDRSFPVNHSLAISKTCSVLTIIGLVQNISESLEYFGDIMFVRSIGSNRSGLDLAFRDAD